MAQVRFTSNLKRFFPQLAQTKIAGATVRELVDTLDAHYPGLRGYIVDDSGRLRQHVNIFLDNEMVADRETLRDAVTDGTDVYVAQALSGG